jgi:16S rRNA (cytosine967-C5)-methyltransferase
MAIDRGAWSAETLATKSARLDSRDAGLASDLVFGVLRRQGQLDAALARHSKRAIEALDEPVRLALRMGAYQILFLDRVPAHAAVSDSVELVRRAGKSSAAPFVNAVLRNLARGRREIPEGPALPGWLMRRWLAQYGDEAARAMAQASLQPPGRYIRVPDGSPPPPGAVPTEIPGCFEIPTGDPGAFRFQDIGSQAVVPLLDLAPGQTFLDLCAAPGNKTSQALETRLHAIAGELHPSRAQSLRTLGIPVVVLDAQQPLPFARTFDRILVDAPCTGTGTLSRNPEIRWRLQPEDIADLASRQRAILSSALAQLSSEGRLVYSTCSLEKEENEDIVTASGARVLQTMTRIPGRDPGDGFFAAVLSRE